MGKTQKKTGKGRIDKFYKLAKEQGYRARSAFKLIQLNKKYGFLESARCTIDLCAAPGGWLQVASKYMPPSSLIVGVDLVPIKPIPKVITFAADITTAQCRTHLRSTLKDWKADVVLHDGAPNVGTAWVQDAYSQSELVLMSLKLAVEFLVKGGTFVTKVFRSVDYNNLMWVFGQLFAKVEATKPPASRNVSAEIFVVCREFHAPKYIDPKFLDPKHVFKDLAATRDNKDDNDPSSKLLVDKSTSANNAHANVFMPEKKRRRRDGYDEGDYTLFRTLSAKDFIYSSATDAVGLLGTTNRITFESEEEKRWKKLKDITSADVLASCEDLKVLGKGDFKGLMKWRTTLREEIGLEVKTKPTEELTETLAVVDEDEGMDEETQIQNELEKLNEEAAARAKRDRRRMNEKKTKTIQRMQLSMVAPMDIGQDWEDPTLRGGPDVFDLKTADSKRKRLLSKEEVLSDEDEESGKDESSDASDDEDLDSENERDRRLGALENDLDGLYDAYKSKRAERDAKFKAREERKKNRDREEAWGGIREEKSNGDSSESDQDTENEVGGWEEMQQRKMGDGSNSSGDDSSASENEEEEGSDDRANHRKRKRADLHRGELTEDAAPRKRVKTSPQGNGLITMLTEHGDAALESRRASNLWFSQDIFADVNRDILANDEDDFSGTDEAENTESGSSSSQGDAPPQIEDPRESDFEIVPREKEQDEDVDMWDVEDEDIDAQKREYVRKLGLNTAEAITLAQQLVNREKTRTQLISDGFNRYSLNSKDGLPSWFLDDEAKHYKPNLPITKEAVMALRAKQKELDARPIKKIAEAKARKKLKASQKLAKAMKKAEGVNAMSDMTEKEKSSQIEQLMKKGLGKGKKKKDEVKLVVAKGANKGLKGRPKGVKGRYRMVDARGKKELRAQKRREKAKKPKRR